MYLINKMFQYHRHSSGLLLLYLFSFFLFQHWNIGEAQKLREIKIGVLIRHRGLEEPLNKTLEILNADNSVLINTRLIAIVELLNTDNSYQASAAICRLIGQQVWAIIGPQSIQLRPILQSISYNYHIPLVLINWQPETYYMDSTMLPATEAAAAAYRGGENSHKRQTSARLAASNNQLIDLESVPEALNYTVNLYPMADQLSRAYLDLMRYKQWKSFTLVYDSTESFLLVKDILETSFSDTTIHLRKIDLPLEYSEATLAAMATAEAQSSNEDGAASGGSISGGGDDGDQDNRVRRIEYCNFETDETGSPATTTSSSAYLPYRKLMKDLRKRGVENLVLSMSLDRVCKCLKEAANVGLLTAYNDFVIANLDVHLLNLTQLQPFTSNISGYSLLDPEGQQTNFAISKNWLGRRPAELPKKLLSTEYSLMSDAISLVAYSLDELLTELANSGGGNSRWQVPGNNAAAAAPPPTSCQSNEPWPYGELLMDLLKRTVRQGGYTGDIKFDRFGQRVDFNLDYIHYKRDSFKKIGTWDMEERLADNSKSQFDFGLQAIKNKTLTVTVARTPPYVMFKRNYTDYFGNDRYEGYCIDLMNKLAKKLQFKYIIKEVSDGQYGKIQNGSWTGMIRELLDWRADLAIVDLTFTKERQSAVDFTHPFMTLGIAIMYKKPKLEEAEMYSFLMPLSTEVWLATGSALVGISLCMWIVSRLSPVEWRNPHPCFDNPDDFDLENEIHSIGASLWFTIGSLMQQGSDLAPRSPSVRALSAVWFFFTLILISSYTANFAAFLTASRMQSPIESAEDLSKQTKIDYGCKEGGSTQAFFASSNHSTYRRMWNFMESRKHQGVFPTTNDKGITMVKKGNFAFLMESTSIEYMIQRDCELTQIGGLLDHKGYGIALRKRSPFRAPLSKSIVELNEAGELQDLKNRWWSTEDTKCNEEKDSASATSELGIDKVGGVFVLLVMGLMIASLAALMEFIWKSLKTPRDQRNTIGAMLWREVLRILKCGPSKRPAGDSTYKKSDSHLSMTNLNENASAISGNGGGKFNSATRPRPEGNGKPLPQPPLPPLATANAATATGGRLQAMDMMYPDSAPLSPSVYAPDSV